MPDALEEVKELVTELAKKSEAAATELRKQNEKHDGIIKQLSDEIEQRGGETAEIKTSFKASEEKLIELEKDVQDLVEKLTSFKGGGTTEAKSVGQVAAMCEQLKGYRGGNMDLVEIEKATVTSAGASAGELVAPLRRPGVIMNPDQPLFLRDLLTTVAIATSAVEWVEENVFTNAAAYQAAEGDIKAESGITFTAKSGTVKTIAHWIPASKQILADAPALQGIIDSRLRYGLAMKEETELLTGDGTGNNIHGIIPQATAYNDALNVAGDTAVDKMRHAILQGTLSLYPVDAFVFNPADWEKIELTKTDDKAYLFTNPVNGMSPRLWGKRVIETHGIVADTFLTGGFQMGATLWDRELVNVRVAEQHADFFVRNMVAILCEERLMLTVERPSAFITGSITTA